MAYLIDGNNFLGYSSPSQRYTARSKRDLVFKLLKFQRVKRARIILVFDGSPDSGLLEKQHLPARFFLYYPHPGESADERIMEIILKETDRRRFTVVSSDREIQSFAQSKRAKTLSCREFYRELRVALSEYRKAGEEQKTVTSPSPLEMKHWLEVFKKR